MNDAFQSLVIQARTGDVLGAAQAYSSAMGIPIEQATQTMKNIRKVFDHVSARVRIANQEEQPEEELL
jgi:hypothetical protein